MQHLGIILLYCPYIACDLDLRAHKSKHFNTLALSISSDWISHVFLTLAGFKSQLSDFLSTALGQISSTHDLILLMSPLFAESRSKSWRWKRTANWLTIFLKVRNAEITWKVRKRVKMICIAFSKGRFVSPSLHSKKRIKGSWSRRLKSQKPANSGTCNDRCKDEKDEVSAVFAFTDQQVLNTTMDLHYQLNNSKSLMQSLSSENLQYR